MLKHSAGKYKQYIILAIASAAILAYLVPLGSVSTPITQATSVYEDLHDSVEDSRENVRDNLDDLRDQFTGIPRAQERIDQAEDHSEDRHDQAHDQDRPIYWLTRSKSIISL